MSKFVNVKNARKGHYKKIIEKIARTGKCPFCKEDFKYHEKPVFQEKNGWFLTENSWPYKNAGCHLIVIAEKHKEQFSELTDSDWRAVSYLTNWAIQKYRIKGGGLAMRFGNTEYTGASVSHLHFHIISPEINKKTGRSKPVNIAIG